MSTPSAKILVRAEGDAACIRIIGRANFTSSVDFKTVVSELSQRGCHCFLLDLSECVLMDSTFLGLLAGLGLKLSGGNGGQGRQGVELFNPSERILELLDTLGVLRLFKVVQGPLLADSTAQAVPCAPATPSRAEVTRTCIEAHKTLMDLSPANAARFKDVARFLAEGLEKAEAK